MSNNRSTVWTVDEVLAKLNNNPGIQIPFVSQNMKNQFRKHTDLFFAPDLSQIFFP